MLQTTTRDKSFYFEFALVNTAQNTQYVHISVFHNAV
jgi:hypothetical protein